MRDLVKFKASINPHGQVYLPSEVRAELASNRLEILGDARAVVLYPLGTAPADVLRSLNVVIVDLKHRRELESRAESEMRENSPSRRNQRTKVVTEE